MARHSPVEQSSSLKTVTTVTFFKGMRGATAPSPLAPLYHHPLCTTGSGLGLPF